jgi:hypothetical protein
METEIYLIYGQFFSEFIKNIEMSKKKRKYEKRVFFMGFEPLILENLLWNSHFDLQDLDLTKLNISEFLSKFD